VVWFGESLDPRTIERSYQYSQQAQTFLVVGTSAVVQPAANLPLVAKKNGAKVIEFNLEDTPLSHQADEVFHGPASIKLAEWWRGMS
jgi:NAD-dependent deacetylase